MNAYPEKQQYTADDLTAIIAILRDPDCGCLWDKVQTHTSIRMNFLEEAYEAVDAIDLNDPELLCEELGDVMMQVVFHAQIEREAEAELYDKLFTEANMNGIPDDADFKDYLNPDSVKVLQGAKLEESLKDAKPGDRFQFVRNGYFTPDSKHEGVYNRIVTLKDSFKL